MTKINREVVNLARDQNNLPAEKIKDILVFALAPIIVGILIIASWLLAKFQLGPAFLNAGLAIIATIFGGYQRFIAGFQDVFHRRITVNVFVTVALIATLAIGNFLTASILVFIMSAAGALEAYTLDKTRKSIRGLLDVTPKMVTVKRDGAEETIPIEEVKVDDIVVVRPGERIAVDGIVVNGVSSVNQAPITGESVPVEKIKGSEVFSGTLNEEGRIEVRTLKVGADTTLAKIIYLTERAQATRPPVQNLADRFTQWFLPVVVVIALVSFLVLRDIRVAVAVLLVACPCAFAIATPTAVAAGISNMARRAILIKGGIFLEMASKLDALLVDKTGTFTLGRPKVNEVFAFSGYTETEVIHLAAIGEKYSEHPLSKAILEHAKQQRLHIPDPNEFKVVIGKGILAKWQNEDLLIGKEEILREKNIELSPKETEEVSKHKEQGKTIMLVAKGNEPVGLITISDEIRPETKKAISLLKKAGIKNITMLTGDNPVIAKAVAEEIGVDNFAANLLPEQKQEYVGKLQQQGHRVAMLGDGINDAPALAKADIGIAMGGSGTDVAIETADVSLMKDDLYSLVDFVATSKKVFQRIKLNIFFSIIYNVIGLTLASIGKLTPVWAIIFQEAGCLTVVISSTLLLWHKPNLPKGREAEVITAHSGQENLHARTQQRQQLK